MACRTIVLLEDDVDGLKADETIEFGIDGTTYANDLSDSMPRSSWCSRRLHRQRAQAGPKALNDPEGQLCRRPRSGPGMGRLQ
jgi:Lsr2